MRDAARRHLTGRAHEVHDASPPPAGLDGVLALQPTRFGALIPQLHAWHDALRPGGRLVVADVVWQTAPSPALARAFTTPGREKVRPIEGFEMQLDHAGFRIVERLDFGRDDWLAFLAEDDPRRPAIEKDDRGACRVSCWLCVRE